MNYRIGAIAHSVARVASPLILFIGLGLLVAYSAGVEWGTLAMGFIIGPAVISALITIFVNRHDQ